MQPTNHTLILPNRQPRRPRNQAEFRSVYIADLELVATSNGVTLTDVPQLPIPRPKSRTGRKALQKTFDAACRRLRREARAPARTGPPIPHSERNGLRRWYTLEQCRHGGRLSGIARRDQAMPRWEQIQQLHYRRHGLRAIARRVGISHTQVCRVVSGRLWRMDRSPSRVVVHSVQVPPRRWARVLALNEVYRTRCRGGGRLYKRMTARQEGYLRGIIRHRGVEQGEEIEMATTSYVQSLSALDVAAAVRQVNQDAGYKPAAGTYHGATYGQRRGLSFDGLRGRRFLGMGQVYSRKERKND